MHTTASNPRTDGSSEDLHNITMVLDNGSDTLRAGFADCDRPSLVMPSIVGRPKYTCDLNGAAVDASRDEEVIFGDEVLVKRHGLKLSYPVCWGLVQNWDDLNTMWKFALEQKLQCRVEESPLVVTESAYMVPKIHREKQTELVFESLHVPAFYLAPAPAAVLYSLGKITGLVIDIGRSNVRIVPVFETYCLPHAVMKYEIGSENVTDFLSHLLSQKGVSLRPRDSSEEVRRMMETLAYVAQDYQQEKDTFSTSQERTYTLPNGKNVTVGQERFQCAEALLQPSLLGMEVPGLAEHVVLTISKCDPGIRQPLLSNVVLVGGGSKLPGLAARLQHDVERKLRDQPDLQGLRVEVLAPPEADLAVWRGGTHVARMPQFPNMCITKDVYDECGPSVVHRKCWGGLLTI
ncbi:actin-3-like [Babylonia areolata]|uniref:actin-3-like n=1 Tax=Babylonia areolata TaxID=304850 RepID=UPI003FD14D28